MKLFPLLLLLTACAPTDCPGHRDCDKSDLEYQQVTKAWTAWQQEIAFQESVAAECNNGGIRCVKIGGDW